jgi:hypothetical protein
MSAGNLPGEYAPRDLDKNERLQYADGYDGFSESVVETGREATADIMQHSGMVDILKYSPSTIECNRTTDINANKKGVFSRIYPR